MSELSEIVYQDKIDSSIKHMNFCFDPQSKCFHTAFMATDEKNDSICFADYFMDGSKIEPETISEDSFYNGWPCVLASKNDKKIYWIACEKSSRKWHIFSYDFYTKKRESIFSTGKYLKAIKGISCKEKGVNVVSFEEGNSRGQSIKVLIIEKGKTIKEFDSGPDCEFASRPSLSSDGKSVFVAYDAYSENGYDVWAASISLDNFLLERKRLSRNKHWNTRAVVCPLKDSIYFAYLEKTNVIDNNKAVDQLHKIRVFRAGKDIFSSDENAEEIDAIPLNQGLVPIKTYTGYVGNRLDLRLIPDEAEQGACLFFEIKFDESIGAGNDRGGLLFKSYSEKRISNLRLLHENIRYCTMSDSLTKGALPFCGTLPPSEKEAGSLRCIIRDISDSKEFSMLPDENWKHWTEFKKDDIVRDKDFSMDNILWGDTHCHGKMSGDAEGDIDEIYFYARDVSCLDFWANTDNDSMFHQERLSHIEWEYQKAFSENFNSVYNTLSIPGYEYSYPALPRKEDAGDVNHRITLFRDRKAPLLRHRDREGREIDSFSAFADRHNALTYSHHLNWRFPEKQKTVYAEICSSWQICIDNKNGSVYEYLSPENDKRVVFIGSSDSHRKTPGFGGALTAVKTNDRSVAGIIDAIRKGHCYVTTGSRYYLEFRVNGRDMGEHIETSSEEEVYIKVSSSVPLREVIVFKNTEVLKTFNIENSNVFEKNFTINIKEKERHCLWCEIVTLEKTACLPGNYMPAFGNRAWSNPVWCNY